MRACRGSTRPPPSPARMVTQVAGRAGIARARAGRGGGCRRRGILPQARVLLESASVVISGTNVHFRTQALRRRISWSPTKRNCPSSKCRIMVHVVRPVPRSLASLISFSIAAKLARSAFTSASAVNAFGITDGSLCTWIAVRGRSFIQLPFCARPCAVAHTTMRCLRPACMLDGWKAILDSGSFLWARLC